MNQTVKYVTNKLRSTHAHKSYSQNCKSIVKLNPQEKLTSKPSQVLRDKFLKKFAHGENIECSNLCLF